MRGIQEEIRNFEQWVNQELLSDDEGGCVQVTFKMPTKKVVCPSCRGEGTSTRYLGDVTEMIREDPDFGEDYWAGHYDRTCDECEGKNVVDEVVEGDLPADLYNHWQDWLQSIAETRAIERSERMMGA